MYSFSKKILLSPLFLSVSISEVSFVLNEPVVCWCNSVLAVIFVYTILQGERKCKLKKTNNTNSIIFRVLLKKNHENKVCQDIRFSIYT